MNTDLPLVDPQKDKLGRNELAKEIARGLVYSFKDSTESTVLGINGTWGIGKSTLLNFIIDNIEKLSGEENQEIVVLRFNPWMFSGQKELQMYFLKELILKLNGKSEKLKAVSEKVAKFLDRLSWVKYLHSGVQEGMNAVSKLLKDGFQEKNLIELKKDIDDILIEKNIKLYITIDDIDRLTPREITDIFQLVKLNGNFSNTIFILSYDLEVVESALQKEFNDFGKKYMEKIVQIDYTLPPISKTDLSRLFIDSLNVLFKDPETIDIITGLSGKIRNEQFVQMFNNLRDVYRFCNSIKLRLPLIIHDLNVLDFLRVEFLRLFQHQLYRKIIENKEELTYRHRKNKSSIINNSNEVTTESYIEKFGLESDIESILKSLFIVERGLGYTEDSTNLLIRGKRVADRNYFDRYFGLKLSNTDIKEVVYRDFIFKNSVEENIKILEEIRTKDQLPKFLDWLMVKSTVADDDRLGLINLSVLCFCNKLPYEEPIFFGTSTEYSIVLDFFSNIFKERFYHDSKETFIFELIRENRKSSSLILGNSILNSYEEKKKGKFRSYYRWFYLLGYDHNNEVFIEELKKELKDLCRPVFKSLIESYTDQTFDEIKFILLFTSDIDIDFYTNNLSEILSDDSLFIRIIWIAFSRVAQNSFGELIYKFGGNSLIRGMEKEKVKERLDTFDLSKYSEGEKLILDFFIRSYKNENIEDISSESFENIKHSL
ncbi:P-loop NTPase fold protein [Tenacibaculum sp. 190524A05c]|uniref:KAP family P-loop NTPase fold protein n=1 Tax=Tenacibaculum platacis TaxID=3137852 RepID=UPI0032B243DE